MAFYNTHVEYSERSFMCSAGPFAYGTVCRSSVRSPWLVAPQSIHYYFFVRTFEHIACLQWPTSETIVSSDKADVSPYHKKWRMEPNGHRRLCQHAEPYELETHKNIYIIVVLHTFSGPSESERNSDAYACAGNCGSTWLSTCGPSYPTTYLFFSIVGHFLQKETN